MAIFTSNFSRTKANESKMGAYYTDNIHCADIAKMLVFPQGKEVCCLEPSIGDGSAILTVTKASQNPNIKIFGVELNDSAAAAAKNNPLIEEIVCCDFTDELMATKNTFSFAFANPPYMETVEERDGKTRLERVFLDRIADYLKYQAVLVWVIPEKAFCDPNYVRAWVKDYDTLALYKFREGEYSKWHQIVAIGRKVRRRAVSSEQIQAYMETWKFGDIPELPKEPVERIEVYPSDAKQITLFTTRAFNDKEALLFLQENGIPAELRKSLNRRLTVSSENGMELSRPPIPLKKDSKYLLLTSGFSDGFVGNEDDGTLHLMRGVAQVTEKFRMEEAAEDEDEDVRYESGTSRLVVTTSTDSELRIIEADGKITLLK